MPSIDADAHIIEVDETWEYMDPSERQYKPGTTYKTLESGEVLKYWIIGGRAIRTPRPGGGAQGELGQFIGNVVLPIESKYMLDVQARVHHMDELGTDLQVLYPSMWTGPITTAQAEEVAICRSYNRWMADIHSQGKGRFRWAAVVPVLDLEEAERQLKYSKDHGAVAVNFRGVETGNRLINDPYFYPLYEVAGELEMPICPHSRTGSFEIDAIWGGPLTAFERNKFSGLSAFHTLLMTGLPDRFPNTKWGIIEFSADWNPLLFNDVKRR
jgi:predicted TIM-barrel fold metal-dependent hydrolase